ncbi:hypothetical protein V8J36_04020 [Frigidibacter sp. MR17.14]|uniref:hypothetical protein n=1 Tax=Frigidibacter sp. MR17.14 TaxID=3126509 RepID=UPI003012C2B1
MSARFNRTAPALAALAALSLSAGSAFALDFSAGDDPIPFAPRSNAVASRASTDFEASNPGLHGRAVVNSAGEQIGTVRGFAKEGTGDAHRLYVALDNSNHVVSFVTSATYGKGPIVLKDTAFVTGRR